MKTINITLSFMLVGVYLAISACFTNGTKITIMPLKFLDTVIKDEFKGKLYYDKFESYKVIGYTDSEESLKFIDDFVGKHKDPHLSKYAHYSIIFYLPSDETDSISLKQHPDRYYNQGTTICEYEWINGDFAVRYKFKDGKIIEPKQNIQIKDMPIPKDSL